MPRSYGGDAKHCKGARMIKHVTNETYMCSECGVECEIEKHWYGDKFIRVKLKE